MELDLRGHDKIKEVSLDAFVKVLMRNVDLTWEVVGWEGDRGLGVVVEVRMYLPGNLSRVC